MAGVIPSFSLNVSMITNPSDQVAYIIRHAFHNPGWTSSFIDDQLVSMRKLRAQYTEDKEYFINALQAALQRAIEQYQPTFIVSISGVNSKTVPNAYKLIIVVNNSLGECVLNMDSVRVVDGVLLLKSDLRENEDDL